MSIKLHLEAQRIRKAIASAGFVVGEQGVSASVRGDNAGVRVLGFNIPLSSQQDFERAVRESLDPETSVTIEFVRGGKPKARVPKRQWKIEPQQR